METDFDAIVRWFPGIDDLGFGGALPVSQDGWITRADYPLRDVLGGTTTVAFNINQVGRIEDCRVVRSSDYLVLDATVCRLLRQRATVLPPLDAAGERTSTVGQFSYRWPFG